MTDLISKRTVLDALQREVEQVQIPEDSKDPLREQVACGVKVGAENAWMGVLAIKQPWVSVLDSMPNAPGPYLVYTPTHTECAYHVRYLTKPCKPGQWRVPDTPHNFYFPVSHWMELPTQPVVTEEEIKFAEEHEEGPDGGMGYAVLMKALGITKNGSEKQERLEAESE